MKVLDLKTPSQKFPFYVNLDKSEVSSEKNYEDKPIDRISIMDTELGIPTVDLSFKEEFQPRKDQFDPRMVGALVYHRYNYIICEACYEKDIDCSNCYGQRASVQKIEDLIIPGRDYKMLEKALGYSPKGPSPEGSYGSEGFDPNRFGLEGFGRNSPRIPRGPRRDDR